MNERSEILDGARSELDGSQLAAGNGTYDLSLLNKERLNRFRDVSASIVAGARGFELDNGNLYAFACGTLHGFSDDEDHRRRGEVFTAFRHDGGTAAILKKFPIPDDITASPEE